MHLTPLFPFGNQSERPDLWHRGGHADARTLATEGEGGCLHFVSDRGREARMQWQKRFCKVLQRFFFMVA